MAPLSTNDKEERQPIKYADLIERIARLEYLLFRSTVHQREGFSP